MRNLLVIKHVTLDKIWISYDSAHTQYKLNLSYNPDIIYCCSRPVTKKQMESLGLALCYDSKKFEGYLTNISSNLITFPLNCDLVMVDQEIVAIGIDDDNCYCHLQTGTVCSKEELFNICKLSKLERMLTEIKFLSNKLRQMMTEYEELESSTFSS